MHGILQVCKELLAKAALAANFLASARPPVAGRSPMPDPHALTHPRAANPSPARSRPAAIFAVTLLFAVAGALLLGGPARGQSKSEQLQQVRERQAQLAEQIQSHNGEVNALIGQVSAIREREAIANAELAERQAELERTTAELERSRERLAELREQFARASAELEEMLVALYKSGSPDIGALLLDSSNFEDFALQNEYFNRLQSYQSAVIERAAELRDETESAVTELAGERARIEQARDEIAARRDEIAASRAELESREAELAAARRARRTTLASLGRREDRLVDALSTPAPAASTGVPSAEPAPAPVPGQTAKLGADGKAIAPAGAPAAVQAAIAAANEISDTPYLWGGGHGSFESSGYDCSGAVSYALHGGGLVASPLDSTGYMFWGDAGAGRWITVYANSGHAYVVIAGLRFDTSGGAGPRWHADARSSAGFVARHPSGLSVRHSAAPETSLTAGRYPVSGRADPHLLPRPRPRALGRLLREARLRGGRPDADRRRGDQLLHGPARRRRPARADPQPRCRRAL